MERADAISRMEGDVEVTLVVKEAKETIQDTYVSQ